MSDPDAMKIVLNRYDGNMIVLSTRKMHDERENTYYGVD
ncbi:MAG: helix-turn-helix domain-containing protein [Lachnospiraceae bacterium]|nr:helix-turn-helix domain-containing protein [Lachnospiraceae bacterium]